MRLRALALIAAAAASAMLFACSTPPKATSVSRSQDRAVTPHAPSQPQAQGLEAKPLTHEEALTRFKQIAHVTYGLWFGLDEQNSDYEGRATINFEVRAKAKEHGKDLFVDFYDGLIHSIILNGTTLPNPAEHYDGNRIHFSLSELQPGTNRVEIAFLHKYGTNGHGLHKFKDPEDDATYLYTDNEPYFAHNIFPCFDQPDLKAAYELTVATPEDWQVVANTMERDSSMVDGKKVWVFPPTPLLSTYLFALIAGDYASWKSDANGIPLRLFARKSVKKWVDAKEWFDTTRKGLDFYSTEFGYPYPYSKYDQILVPDFDEGAMENAGAVTFAERHIFRTKVPVRKHMRRANTILHEMAHMWFGDLVTMKWWNGLWLNESFADFMAAWAVDESSDFKGSWQEFFSEDKGWAYWQDQLVTTHPIELPVPDTDHAFSNFDGITYGKGAAAIKQLRYYLGGDDFREGLQRYFQKYALRNSTLGEFVKMLAEASEKDLGPWQEAWLTTPGANTVRADWACDPDKKISKFDLLQDNAPESKNLRPHRTEVALFAQKGGKYGAREIIPVTYSKDRTTVAEALGKPCPEFVYPNYRDQDYVKVNLDAVSAEKSAQVLKHIEEPAVRQMIWAALWDQVVDGVLAPTTYLKAVLGNLGAEHDPFVLPQVIDTVAHNGWDAETAMKFVDPKDREPLFTHIEELFSRQLRAAPAGSDLQLIWFDAFLGAVHTPKGLDLVAKLLNRKASVPGLKIDQEVRWSLVSALARNGFEKSSELVETEFKADPSHFGQQNRLKALAAIPSIENKNTWLEQIINTARTGKPGTDLSSSDLKAVMGKLNSLGQESLTDQWIAKYFEALPSAAHSTDEEFMTTYVRDLFPKICSERAIELAKQALSSALPAGAEKDLKTHVQEEERCLRARALAAQVAASKPVTP